MCGIAGIYLKDENKKAGEDILSRMCQSLQHRGPDDQGYFSDGNIGLGIRRLSVIDLAKGHQPIHNEDKTVWVVLNGEIYNYLELRLELAKSGHAFYTDSDTEVIAHLYEEKKEECLNDLSGMFALAVLDTKNRALFIARDRMGIKPLYYYNAAGAFLFFSELKAVLDFPGFDKEIDPESLFHFFSLNYIPAPGTAFKAVKQLSAGHYLSITKEGLKIKEYWDIPFGGHIEEREDTVIDKLEYLLKKSVKGMLKSDVPLGAFLSGGLDSTALVSLIKENSSQTLKTFSVGFREDSYDESYFADLAAAYLGTEHYRAICRPSDVIQSLPKMIWHADNLLADPAMLPLYCVSKLAREHVTVCISGDGGDELFCGYPTYLADAYLKYYKKIPYFIRRLFLEKIVNLLPVSDKKLSFDYKIKKFVEGGKFLPEKAHYWWRTVFTDEEKKALFSEDMLREIGRLDSYSVYARRYNDCSAENQCLFDKFTYADLKVWLTDNNLIRVDAMSMARSLEVRVPFLDHKLVEFMAALPQRLKIKNCRLKYLLKKAMQGRLPQQIINRRKSGWHVPLAGWFREDLRDYVSETLKNPKVNASGFFKKGYIDNLLQEHSSRRRNHAFKIWGLLVFFHWYDTFC